MTCDLWLNSIFLIRSDIKTVISYNKSWFRIINSDFLIDVMKDMTEDSELFKLNFVVIVSNGLIERNTTSYVIRDILDYDIDLDNCAAYNWGEYLISCLVKTKNNWISLKSLFYPGPIVFLIVSTFYHIKIFFENSLCIFIICGSDNFSDIQCWSCPERRGRDRTTVSGF